MSRIAIIGGSGFVGSYLKKSFIRSEIKYSICDINNNSEIVMDVEDPNQLKFKSDVSAIINLAAIHRDDIRPLSRYDEVNVQGAVNICDAARKQDINKIIFTSSVAIYGISSVVADESGEPNYFNDYGRTKYLAEQIYKKWQAEDTENRTLVIVRPTVIFGEGNRGNVYNLLKQIASNRFVMFGDGKNIKSMAYVENVVSFLEFGLSFKPGLHIYNYVDEPDFDINTLVSETRKILYGKNNVGIRLPRFLGIAIGYFADFIAKFTGKTLPVSSIRVKKFMGNTQFKSSINKTGFVPPVSLKEGLLRTIRYEFIDDNSDKHTFESE